MEGIIEEFTLGLLGLSSDFASESARGRFNEADMAAATAYSLPLSVDSLDARMFHEL